MIHELQNPITKTLITKLRQIDKRLNDDKFIIPGLGDAGDRAYNTPE